MNLSLLLAIILILVVLALILVIGLMIRVKRLESKALDISARDVAAFTNQMREVLVESERVAERLDNAIRDRESALEDLGDLVDARIRRMKELGGQEEESLQKEIHRLMMQGRTNQEIARILNISVGEVDFIATLR